MYIDPETKTVSVHGREALDLPYSRWTSGDVVVQLDISDADMFIEIPAANLRKKLVVNPADTKGLRIFLTRAEVALLPQVPTPYILIDETDIDQPILELEGKIYRTGYTNQPILPPSNP